MLPEAQRHLNRLSPAVREAALEAIHGPIAADPRRVGEPLRDELEGLWCARRDVYRIVYENRVGRPLGAGASSEAPPRRIPLNGV